MRPAVCVLLVLLASCGEEPSALPAGSLRLHRDGMLRAGREEAPDAAAVLKARAAEGRPVSIEIDGDAPFEGVERLVSAAARGGLASMEFVTGAERLRILLGSRPAPPVTLPPVPKPPSPEVSQSVDGIQIVARPDRSEMLVRVLKAPAAGDAGPVKEAAAGLARRIPGSAVLAIEAPRATPWGRLAPIVAAAGSTLEGRLARHEFTTAP